MRKEESNNAEDILAKFTKCKYCGSYLKNNEKNNFRVKENQIDETFGNLVLVIPIVFISLSYSWLWRMESSNNPSLIFDIMGYLTYFATAIIATIEASKIGIGSVSDLNKKGKKRFGPIVWFIFVYFVWTIGYPWYLYHRSKYGMKNRLREGILISIILHITLIIFYFFAPWK